MKRIITILLCLCLVFCLTGCKRTTESQTVSKPAGEVLSVTKYSDATGKYYEETENGYKAAFYKKNDLSDIKKLDDWVNSCEASDKYYEYVYSDPDSWDMYICYNPEVKGFKNHNFKFSVVDQIVKIYMSSDGGTYIGDEDFILIRVQAPYKGAWPVASELYLDGVKLDCSKKDFNI